MAQKNMINYEPEVNLSQYLDKELSKSIKFQKKHQKELSNLLAYQKMIQQEKEKNENKLQKMFYKEKVIDHQKKQKEDYLKEQKVNKDHEFLYKQKENDYINSLDASWCFYQDYSSSRDLKPLKVDAEREKVLRFLYKQLQNTTDHVERALIKKKINKFHDSQVFQIQLQIRHKKLNYIDQKIEYAKQVRSESLDRSIDKIRMHDMHILDVKEKSNKINLEKQQYFKEKFDTIEDKIKLIEKQQLFNKQEKLSMEQQKDQHRSVIKSNSLTLMQQKELLNQNHFNERIFKLNYLEDQRQKLLKQRQELTDQLNQKRQIARQSLDDVIYPQLNSINYKAKHY